MARPGAEERQRILLRRLKIEELLDRGFQSSVEITARLGGDATDETQCRKTRRDIEAIDRLRQREDKSSPRGRKRARQISRLKRQLREALEAWERSKTERQSSRAGRRQGGRGEETHTELRKEQRDGDPRFLMVAAKLEAQLAKLEGTERPRIVRQRHSQDPAGTPIQHEHHRIPEPPENFGQLSTAEQLRRYREAMAAESGN